MTLIHQSNLAKIWKKGYCTGDSQAVTHPSTNPACGCLTSEIERDRVHSTEYGRIRHSTISHHFIPCLFLKLPAPNYYRQCTEFPDGNSHKWHTLKPPSMFVRYIHGPGVRETSHTARSSVWIAIFDLLSPSRWEGRPKGSVTGLRREPVEH